MAFWVVKEGIEGTFATGVVPNGDEGLVDAMSIPDFLGFFEFDDELGSVDNPYHEEVE